MIIDGNAADSDCGMQGDKMIVVSFSEVSFDEKI